MHFWYSAAFERAKGIRLHQQPGLLRCKCTRKAQTQRSTMLPLRQRQRKGILLEHFHLDVIHSALGGWQTMLPQLTNRHGNLTCTQKYTCIPSISFLNCLLWYEMQAFLFTNSKRNQTKPNVVKWLVAGDYSNSKAMHCILHLRFFSGTCLNLQ